MTRDALAGVQAVDFAALLPAVAPVLALLLILGVDAIAPRSRALRQVHDGIAILGLLGSALAVGVLALGGGGAGGGSSTACVPGVGLSLESCSYVVSPFTLTLQALVAGSALVCLLLAVDGPTARDRTPHHVLLLAAVAGAVTLAGARDLATLVVALETSSLPAIGLVALRRDAQGAQGAVTLLLTAVTSLGLLLLGVALLLLATGSLHLDRIATVLADGSLPTSVRAVAVLGIVFALAGIAFKLSAVPFHLWTPDTYAGAPLPVAAFLAVVSKAAGVAAVLVLLAVGLPGLGDVWAPVVGGVAALTVTVGNLVALRQRVAIRLLAWSTVAQAGWVLLPLAAVVRATPGAARSAAAGSVGYLVAYAVASLAAFAVVIVFARHHPDGEEHTLEAYRGLGRREPVAAAILGFALLCLAGLPPGVVGLVAKLVAVRPLVDSGAWFLALVAAANVALGIAYYLRWTALLVGGASSSSLSSSSSSSLSTAPPSWRVRPAEGIALGASAAACVALSVLPQLVAGVLPSALR